MLKMTNEFTVYVYFGYVIFSLGIGRIILSFQNLKKKYEKNLSEGKFAKNDLFHVYQIPKYCMHIYTELEENPQNKRATFD
jgi:hypothetical protein